MSSAIAIFIVVGFFLSAIAAVYYLIFLIGRAFFNNYKPILTVNLMLWAVVLIVSLIYGSFNHLPT